MKHLYMGQALSLKNLQNRKRSRLCGAGYYIHSCQKMKYKGEYSPSYLADPVCHSLPRIPWFTSPLLQEDFSWHPLSVCRDALDRFRYACFTHPEHSLE